MSLTAPDFAQIPMSANLGSTLVRASDIAASTGAGEVTLEHLLAGLCDDPDALAVLDASHVVVANLKADVTSRILHGAQAPALAGSGLGIAQDVRRILEAAAAAARGSRRRDINGAIVLAAIVGDARSVAAEILQAHGLTFEGAIRALQTALAPAPPRDAPAVAEDVLARARERVQSRAAPSLNDIMKDLPRPVPPPPIVSQPVAEPPFSAPAPPTPVPETPTPMPEAAAPRPPEKIEPQLTGLEAAPSAKPADIQASFAEEVSATKAPDSVAPDVSATVQPGPLSAPSIGEGAPKAPVGGPAPSFPRPPAPEAEPSLSFPTQAGSAPPGDSPAGIPGGIPGGIGDSRRFSARPAAEGIGAASPPPRDLLPEFSRPRPVGPQPPPIPPAAPAQAGPPGMRVRPPAPMPGPLSAPMPGGIPPGGSLAQSGLRVDRPASGGPAPQQQPAPVAAAPKKRGKAGKVEAGQLAENIPRTMRVGKTERAEIRIAKASVKALTDGLEGGGPVWQHSVAITKAMAVRLRAPEGGFFIETASPETQWIENSLGYASDDFASWRFLITPQSRGWARLQIIVSARTVGADGVAAETALPDQVVEVKVRRNIRRMVSRLLSWTVAAVLGGALSTFGETGINVAKTIAQKFMH